MFAAFVPRIDSAHSLGFTSGMNQKSGRNVHLVIARYLTVWGVFKYLRYQLEHPTQRTSPNLSLNLRMISISDFLP